jgi:HK97 gp10 family phage protein
MIAIETEVKGDALEGLDKLDATIKKKVLFAGAASMAGTIVEEVRFNVSPPKMGIVTGNLHNSIYWAHAEDRSTDESVAYHVSWNKKKAPHGHLLEYGTSRMTAKPFMRPAYDAKIHDAIDNGLARMAKRMKDL